MAESYVTRPDGTQLKVTHPEGASHAEIIAAVEVLQEQPPPKRQESAIQNNVDYAQRLLNEIVQGYTFQTTDELGGGVGALASYLDPRDPLAGQSLTDRYRGIRDAARDREEQFQEAYPKAALTANLGGGVAQGVGAAQKFGRTMLENPGKTGAAFGLLTGAGASEQEGLLGQLLDTGAGGLTGAALARLFQPIANTIGTGLQSAVTYPARATATRPTRVIAERIQRDDMTPEQVAANLRKLPPGGSILDAAGTQTQRLAEDLITLPGRASNMGEQFFRNRQRLALPRVDELLARVFKTKGGYHQALKDLDESLRTKAGPLYDSAYAQPVRPTPEIRGVMTRLEDSAPDVLERARRNLRLDGPKTGSNMRYYDYVKRELDDYIGEAQRAGRANQARVFIGLKNTLVRELDGQVPDYKAARDVFSSDARMKDALEAGRQFLREDAEDIADAVAGFTPGELEMFRLGAARHLRDKVGLRSDTADVYKAFYNKPVMRERIEQLFPDMRDRARLQRGMLSEQTMFETGARAKANSRTAGRLEGIKDIATDPDVAAGVLSGNVLTGARRALEKWWQANAGKISNEGVRDELARIVFKGSRDEQLALLERLQSPQPRALPLIPRPPGLLQQGVPAISGSAPGALLAN